MTGYWADVVIGSDVLRDKVDGGFSITGGAEGLLGAGGQKPNVGYDPLEVATDKWWVGGFCGGYHYAMVHARPVIHIEEGERHMAPLGDGEGRIGQTVDLKTHIGVLGGIGDEGDHHRSPLKPHHPPKCSPLML